LTKLGVAVLAIYDTQKVEMQITVQALALEFSHALRSELSAEHFQVIIQRNREQISKNICHSNDFCDANMVLHAVFFQHGMDAADEGGMDRWGEIWSQVWGMAKAEEFLISGHTQS
jgi:hypothetical protein